MTLSLTEKRYTASAESTQALGRYLGQLAQPGDFIACNGPWGLGKPRLFKVLLTG